MYTHKLEENIDKEKGHITPIGIFIGILILLSAGISIASAGTVITVNPGESIQAAIDSLPSEGGIVELARGIHTPTASTQIINRSNITIRGGGASREDTVINCNGDYHKFYIENCTIITIENMYFHSATGDILGGAAIAFLKTSNVKISNIRVERIVTVISTFTKGGYGQPSSDEYFYNFTIEDCLFSTGKNAIQIYATCNSIIRRCEFDEYTNQGIYVNGFCKNNIIEDCVIHGSDGFGISIYSACVNNTIKNNTFYNNGFRPWHSGAVDIYSSNSNTIVVDNVMKDNAHGITVTTRGGGPFNLQIRNNRIYDNLYNGIKFIDDYGSGGNTEIESNTICSNGYDGIRLQAGVPETYIISAKNNIITGNSGYGINRIEGNIISSYNNVWSNTLGSYNNTTGGPGNVSVDPLFADHASGDFHLKSTAGRWKGSEWVIDTEYSPCIDKGDPYSDHSNEPEPNGRRINMGAYGNTGEASKTPSIETYNTSGYVKYENGTGIYNAHVANNVTSTEDYTDENGYYILTGLANGTYNVTASNVGFYSNFTIVTVNGADVKNADIILIELSQDTTPPVISDVQVSSITPNSATITWSTNELANSLVKFGTSSGTYTQSASNASYTTSHSINLTGFTANTAYYFVVNSTDTSGNSNESNEYNFTTAAEGIDTTPPTTTFVITPSANEKGWNNVTPVVVTFFRSDTGGSGIAYANYSKNSETGPWTTVNISAATGADAGNVMDISEGKFNVTVSDEGTTEIWYYSVDTNTTPNVETTKNVTVKINTTPPASISNLQNSTGTTWINWTWNNPPDEDFNHTMVYLNGVWQTNTSNPYYNTTGLNPDTSYEIGTHTVDTNGNVNNTWVNQTTKTVNNLIPRYDVNEDGTVDILDTTIVGQHFGETTSPPYPRYDVNEDGTVDILDTTIVGQHFGEIMW